MIYKNEFTIPIEHNAPQDMVVRDALHKFIADLPMSELEKVFSINVFDPRSERCENILNNYDVANPVKEMVMDLKYRNLVKYEIEIRTF